MVADKTTTDPDRADSGVSLAIDIAASPNPPVIEITAPPPQQVFRPGQPVQIRWSGSDPDGDELTYLSQVSTNGGQRYRTRRDVTSRPFHGDTTSASRDYDVGVHNPIPDTIRFRVVASDGTRSTSAESPTYRVEP